MNQVLIIAVVAIIAAVDFVMYIISHQEHRS